MKVRISIIIFIVIVTLISCEEESPVYDKLFTTYALDSLEDIYVASGIHLFLSNEISDSFTIILTEDVKDLINIERSSKSLSLSLYPNFLSGNSSIEVYMPYKGFESLTAVNGGKITLSDTITIEDEVEITVGRNSIFEGNYINKNQILDLFVTINGLYKGNLDINTLYALQYWTGAINVTGHTECLSLWMEMGPDFTGFEFTADRVDAFMKGNSFVELSVVDTIEVTALNNAVFNYKGTPKTRIIVTENNARIRCVQD